MTKSGRGTVNGTICHNFMEPFHTQNPCLCPSCLECLSLLKDFLGKIPTKFLLLFLRFVALPYIHKILCFKHSLQENKSLLEQPKNKIYPNNYIYICNSSSKNVILVYILSIYESTCISILSLTLYGTIILIF